MSATSLTWRSAPTANFSYGWRQRLHGVALEHRHGPTREDSEPRKRRLCHRARQHAFSPPSPATRTRELCAVAPGYRGTCPHHQRRRFREAVLPFQRATISGIFILAAPWLSPDGKTLLAIGRTKPYDCTILSRASRYPLTHVHTNRCTNSAAFSPDGQRVAIVGSSTAQVVDVGMPPWLPQGLTIVAQMYNGLGCAIRS